MVVLSRVWQGVSGLLPRPLFWLIIALAVAPATSSANDKNTGPAVSGHNGKVSAEGGIYDNEDSVLVLGSYTLPLGHAFGLQLDGAAGKIDNKTIAGGAAHLFTRDPSQYLLGVYASYHEWNDIAIWRAAIEAEYYSGRFSFTGLAGYESINVPATSAGLVVLNKDDDHFFAHADLSYYPTDDLKISTGYRFINETSLGAASVEYLLRGVGVPVSLFAKGTYGETEHNRITGGIKIYLGASRSKPLMSRHRTEDPENITPVFPKLIPQSTNGMAAGPMCGNGIVEAGEFCDDGNTGNGDGCSSTCRIEEAS